MPLSPADNWGMLLLLVQNHSLILDKELVRVVMAMSCDDHVTLILSCDS